MRFFDLFKPKRKTESPFLCEGEVDDEYLIPILSRKSVQMTEELLRRQQDEQLLKKYGSRTEKEGFFI